MNSRLALTILILAFLPSFGCAVGDAWYYPYGPPYFEDGSSDGERPKTISEFMSLPRPD